MVNGELMTVTANGGRGGIGQDGTGNEDVVVQFQYVSKQDDNGGWWFDVIPSEYERTTQLLAKYVPYEDIGRNVYRLYSKCCGTTGLGGAGL